MKKLCKDKNLPRKIESFIDDSRQALTDLAMAEFHPIDRKRLDNYVVEINVEEIGDGFRVNSADAVHINSLEAGVVRNLRRNFIVPRGERRSEVFCAVVFHFKGALSDAVAIFIQSIRLGLFSDLQGIRRTAQGVSKVEVLRELNKKYLD